MQSVDTVVSLIATSSSTVVNALAAADMVNRAAEGSVILVLTSALSHTPILHVLGANDVPTVVEDSVALLCSLPAPYLPIHGNEVLSQMLNP